MSKSDRIVTVNMDVAKDKLGEAFSSAKSYVSARLSEAQSKARHSLADAGVALTRKQIDLLEKLRG